MVQSATFARLLLACAALVGIAAAGFGTTTTSITAETWADPTFVETGDVNGDSVPDTIIAEEGSVLVVLTPANGDPSTATAPSVTLDYPVAQGTSISALCVADLDEDSNLDILIAYEVTIEILYGGGDGTFGAATIGPLVTDPYTVTALAVIHMAANDDLDIVYASSGNTLVLLYGADYAMSTNLMTSAGSITTLAVGDMDGDDVDDLVAGLHSLNQVVIIDGSDTATTYTTAVSDVKVLRLSDIDRDGDLDVWAAASESNEMIPLFNNGLAGLTAGTATAVAAYPQAFAVGDMDLDGDEDLLVAVYDSNKIVACELVDAATGALSCGDELTMTNPLAVAAADYDGDGDADFVASSATANLVQQVIVSTVPLAPESVDAVVLGLANEATVSWTAPSSDNGSPITAYTIAGYANVTGAPSPTVVNGLTIGQSYSFSVYAWNEYGRGASRTMDYAVVPYAVVEATVAQDNGISDVVAAVGVDDSVALLTLTTLYVAGAQVLTGLNQAACMAAGDTDNDGETDLVLGQGSTVTVLPGLDVTKRIDDVVDALVVAVDVRDGTTAVLDLTGTVYVNGVEDSNFSNLSPPKDIAVVDSDNVIACSSGKIDWPGVGTVQPSSTLQRLRVSGDFLVAMDDDGALVYPLDSSTFASATPVVLSAADAIGLELADLDLDGAVDALVATSAPSVGWFSGLSGDFIELADASPLASDAVAVGDWDGDGDTDFAMADVDFTVLTVPLPPTIASVSSTGVSGELEVVWTAGSDNGAAITAFTVSWDGGGNTTVGAETAAVLTGLVDGAEYAVTVRATSYRGTGPASAAVAGTPTSEVAFVVNELLDSAGIVEMVVAADVDGDGLPDVTFVASDSVSVLYNSDGFATQNDEVINGLQDPVALAWGQLNPDTDTLLDVVFADKGADEVGIYRQDTDGSFVELVTHTDTGDAWFVTIYDGDVYASGNTEDAIYLMAGPTFSSRVTIYTDSSDGGPHWFAVNDFAIVVPLRRDSRVAVVDPSNGTELSSTGFSTTEMCIFVDVNHDGSDDAVCSARADDRLMLLLNDGADSLSAVSYTPAGLLDGNWGLAAADVNLDGYTDLLSTSVDDKSVMWWLNDGTGGFTPQSVIVSDLPTVMSVSVADFDGDGDLDAVTHSSSGDVVLLELQTVPFAPTNVAATPLDGAVNVSWAPPPSDNGAPVTEYVVNGANATQGHSLLFEGLTNGETYNFSVAAVSFRGAGVKSETVSATPAPPARVALRPTLVSSGAGFDRLSAAAGGVDVLVTSTNTGALGWLALPGGDYTELLASGAGEGIAAAGSGFYSVGNNVTEVGGGSELHAAAIAPGTECVLAVVNDDVVVVAGGATLVVFSGSNEPAAVTLPSDVVSVEPVDGDDDLLLVAMTANVSLVSRSLAAVVQSRAGGSGGGASSGDVNGDGVADVVLSSLSVCLGADLSACDGSTTATDVDSLELVDLDLDGARDVLFTAAGDLQWRRGAGDGSFAAAETLLSDSYATVAVVGDFDGDGDGDLVATTAADEVYALEVRSVPLAPPAINATALNGGVRVQWTAASDNGDVLLAYTVTVGDDDYTLSSSDLEIELDGLTNGVVYDFSVAASNARGTGPAAVVEATPTTRVDLVSQLGINDLYGAYDVAVADFNADGVLDVVASGDAAVEIYLKPGVELTAITGLAKPAGVAAGDLDGDGDADVALAIQDSTGNEGTVLLLFNGGTDDWVSDERYLDTALFGDSDPRLKDVDIADVNGDGFADVVFVAGVSLWLGYIPGPNFNSSVTFTHSAGATMREVVFVDSGFIAVSANNYLHIVDVLGKTIEQTVATGGQSQGLAAADLNGDGHTDLVVTGNNAFLSVLSDGGQSFASVQEVPTPDDQPFGLAVGDLDLDGVLDVVMTNNVDKVLWARGVGDGTFEDPITLFQDSSLNVPKGVALADFDADGDLDIVVACDSGRDVLWLEAATVPLNVTASLAAPLHDGGSINLTLSADGNDAPLLAYLVDGAETTAVVSGLSEGVAYELAVQATNYRGASAATYVNYSSCADGVLTGTESDVDCGGLGCAPCANGLLCAADADCANGECDPETGRCASCADGVLNNNETSLDCGGPFCAPCLWCSGGDYEAVFEWDALAGGLALLGEDVTGQTSFTVTDAPNYVPVNGTLETADGRAASASCTPRPTPSLVDGGTGLATAATGYSAPALGDVFGADGYTDTIMGATAKLLTWQGNATSQTDVFLGDIATGGNDLKPALGDLDADGDLDLVVGTRDGPLQRLFNDGAGNFAATTALDFGGSQSAPALGDLDGDGALDLVVGSTTDVWWCSPDNATACTLLTNGFAYAAPALCDVDWDGDLDVVIGDNGPQLFLLENLGGGQLASSTSVLVDDVDGVDYRATPSCDAASGALAVGSQSGVTALLVLAGHPEAPEAVATSFPAARSLQLSWDAPVDGGAAITGFTVFVNGTDAGSSALLTGLTPGGVYRVEVQTHNAVGSSPLSAAVDVTVPLVRVRAEPVTGGVEVSWTVSEGYVHDGVATVNGIEATSPFTLLTDECAVQRVNVSLWSAGGGVLETSSVVVSATPPLGVCPPSCSAGANATGWADPTQAAPFEPTCLLGGVWTVLPRDDVASQAALCALSAETLLIRDYDSATLLLDAPPAPPANCTATSADGQSTGTAVAYDFDLETIEVSGLYEADGKSPTSLGEWSAVDTNDDSVSVVVAVRLLALDTAVDRQPAAATPLAANLTRDFALSSNAPGATFEVSVDGAAWAAWAAAEYNATQEGAHSLEARAVLADWTAFVPADATPATVEWTYDVTPPIVTFPVHSRPAAYSSETSVSLGLSASEAGVVFQSCVDSWTPCATLAASAADAEDGPDTTLESVVVGFDSIALEVSGGDELELSLDSGDWYTPSSPTAEFDDVAPGWHAARVRVRADGVADDVGVSLAVPVSADRRAPDTVIASGPAAVGVAPVAALEATATEANCTFEASMDGGAEWTALAALTLSEVPGLYSVAVRAVDAAGNADPTPAMAAWQVVEAPVASWGLVPLDASPFAQSVFAVDVAGGSACVVAYDVDGGAETGEADESGGFVVGPLEYGQHEVVVSTTCDGGVPANELSLAWETTAEAATDTYTTLVGEGPHWAFGVGVDAAGNVGETVVYNWTTDTTPPDTLAVWPSSAVLQSADVAFSANCSEACTLEVWAPDPDAPDGAYNVTVTGVDLAGNADPTPAVFFFVVDTTPPLLSASAASEVMADPEISVTCSDCASWTTSSWSGAEDGPVVVTVRGLDEAGNAAEVNVSFVLDTEPPQTVLVSPVGEYVNTSDVRIDVACVDATSGCTVELDTSLEQGLLDGNHTVRATAVDEAMLEDPSPVVVSFVVDTRAPVVALNGVEYSDDGGSATLLVDVLDDSESEVMVSAPSQLTVTDGLTLSGEDDTYHDVSVRAIDAAGNVGDWVSISEDIVLDTQAPVVSLEEPTEFYTSDDDVELTFTIEDANLDLCTCNGERCAEPDSEEVQFSVVAPRGVEQLVPVNVTCEDTRGHVTTATTSFYSDQVPPVLTGVSGVSGATNNATLWVFEFDVSEGSPGGATATCELSPFVYEAGCSSPWVVDVAGLALADGDYTASVSLEDAAGNDAATELLFDITLDTVAPTLEVFTSAPTQTAQSEVELEFGCVLETSECDVFEADPDCALEFRVAGLARAPVGDDGVAVVDTKDLPHGEIVVRLYGTDLAGNVATADETWTYSAEVLVPFNLTGPPPSVGVSWAEFSWLTAVPVDSFSYRVDDDDWSTVGNSSVRVTGLEKGTRTFSVAVEGDELDAVTWVWTIEDCETEDYVQYTDAVTGELFCDLCPEGVDCLLGVAAVKPGWWWSRGDEPIRADSEFTECRVEAACVGNATVPCAEGYEGLVCDTCSAGFGQSLDGSCQACAGTDSAAVVAVTITMALLLLVTVAVIVVRKSLSTTRTVRAVSTLKIMANYFLMMGILKDFDLDWGSMLTKVFSWMGVVSGQGAADVKLVSCVARVDTFDQFRMYFSIPVLLVVAPAAALWGYAGLRRAHWMLTGREGGSLGSARIWGHSKAFVYRQSVLVLSYFAYPVVVTNSFRVLHCMDIEGESRLVEDYSKPCSGAEYDALMGVGAFFSSAVALGVPLGIFYAMWRHHAELRQAGKAQTQFYFFFGEFKPEWYWWEMTVMARKVLMGAIAVMLNNHEQKMQVYVGTWLLLFSFTAQDPVQRVLESAAQGTVLASLLLGQGMAFEDVTEAQRQTFEWCAFWLNIIVMNCMGMTLGWTVFTEARRRFWHGEGEAPLAAAGVASGRASSVEPATAMVNGRRFTLNPLAGDASLARGSTTAGRGPGRTSLAAGGRGPGRASQGRKGASSSVIMEMREL